MIRVERGPQCSRCGLHELLTPGRKPVAHVCLEGSGDAGFGGHDLYRHVGKCTEYVRVRDDLRRRMRVPEWLAKRKQRARVAG